MRSVFSICPFYVYDSQQDTSNEKMVLWEITGRCVSNCPHCLRGSENMIDYLGNVAQTIDFFNDLQIEEVLISGGDPLLYKDLVNVINRISENQIAVGMYANGTLVNDAIVKNLKEAGLSYAILSLHGSNADIHDSIKGANDFNKTIEAIKIFQDNDLDLDLTLTVGRHNIHDIDSIIKLVAGIGVKALTISPTMPMGKAKDTKYNFMFEPKAAESIAQIIENHAAEQSDLLIERIRFPLPGEMNESNMKCNIETCVYINCRGHVGTCPWMGSTSVGVIQDDNLTLMQKYICAVEDVNKNHIIKSDAIGCPLAAYLLSGHQNGVDPFCQSLPIFEKGHAL